MQSPFGSKPYCSLYIVRHGQTDWNLEKRLQGQTDIPLNSIGKDQASEAAQLLKDIKFDATYSSDLLRAKQTAEIIALDHQLVVKTTELIRERHFGRWEGELVSEIRDLLDIKKALSDEERKHYKHHPEIESDEEIFIRFNTFIREIAATHLNQNILVASHSGSIRIFLIHLGLYTHHQLRADGAIKNSGYIHLLSDGIDFHIASTHGISLNT